MFDPTKLYTVEVRLTTGYDSEIPAEGVLVHEVDLDSQPPQPGGNATVVAHDGVSDALGPGATWKQGETIYLPDGGYVEILERQLNSFVLRVKGPGYRLSVPALSRDP